MRHLKHVGLLTLLLALPLTACGDSGTEPPPPPSFSGAWRGTVTVGEGSANIRLTLLENQQGDVSGSGTFGVEGGESYAITVSDGTHAHPSVSLTLSTSEFTDMNYTGQFVGDNQVSGALNGSGFNGDVLVLNRQ